ncbi:MAG: acetolactate synthase [Lachnospiraceae bacterium]|nr:acetolactate synthase [Lachnospiraceae bacterium]
MSFRQISVFLENRPGALLEMTETLYTNSIDMRAFSLAETSDFGIARIIVDDVEKTAAILREAGYILSITPVIAVEVPNEPGGLRRTLRTLSEVNVNVEYMYAFVGSNPAVAMMVFRVADIEKAVTALESAGIKEVTL